MFRPQRHQQTTNIQHMARGEGDSSGQIKSLIQVVAVTIQNDRLMVGWPLAKDPKDLGLDVVLGLVLSIL